MRTRSGTLIALGITTSACTSTALAGFTQIDDSYFAGAPVVGVDAIGELLDQPVTVGFDFAPDGTPIATPHPAGGSGLFFSDPIENVFASVGLLIDPGSRAVSQPANPAGIGARSGENTLASDFSANPHGTIVFTFTNGVSAAGFVGADGPTNDIHASFFDIGGNLIATLTPADVADYYGIEADTAIGSIVIHSTASDDYYLEDLSFVNVPSPAALPLVGAMLLFRRRR